MCAGLSFLLFVSSSSAPSSSGGNCGPLSGEGEKRESQWQWAVRTHHLPLLLFVFARSVYFMLLLLPSFLPQATTTNISVPLTIHKGSCFLLQHSGQPRGPRGPRETKVASFYRTSHRRRAPLPVSGKLCVHHGVTLRLTCLGWTVEWRVGGPAKKVDS